MQISKINAQPYNNISKNVQLNNNKPYYLNNIQRSNVYHGKDLINFHGLQKIPITDVNSRSIGDTAYIKKLASAVGCPVENLKSVVGLDELKSILKNLNAENFNPNSNQYMINMHTHTKWSDGAATVEEILNEAQQRGKSSGNNFLISITDHDCIESGKEALQLIAKNPERYNRIRFVVGIEPFLKYENPEILKEPIPFDALGYCINPFDEATKNLFETPRIANRNYLESIIRETNKRWGINATFDEACEFHSLIKVCSSSGFIKYSKEYIIKKLKQEGKDFKPEEVTEIFKPYYVNSNGRVTRATTDVKNAIKVIKESGNGELGIAHPGILELNPKVGWNFDFCSNTNLQKGISYDEALSVFIKTCGLKLADIHYLYQERDLKKYPQLKQLLGVINKTCEENGIIAVGGTDSHGNTHGKILMARN